MLLLLLLLLRTRDAENNADAKENDDANDNDADVPRGIRPNRAASKTAGPTGRTPDVPCGGHVTRMKWCDFT
jgi:hypothetical protein